MARKSAPATGQGNPSMSSRWEQDQARAAKRADAIEWECELDVLVGSDKQVAWARTIRAEKIAEAQTELEGMPGYAAAKQRAAAAIAELCAHTAASWWINNRHISGLGLAVPGWAEAKTRGEFGAAIHKLFAGE